MRLRHLLSASLLCWAGMAGARDVHGVNGYYNWTTAQMQTSANLAFGSEGYKFPNWEPRYVFDGDYMKFYLGLNADDRDLEKGGFTNRARLDFREKVTGEGFMVMQPANPVFAVKLSAPKLAENTEGNKGSMWIEFYWHNPYNGTQDEPMPHDGGGGFWGLQPKSFDLFTAHCPWKKDEFGRDSVALKYVSKTDETVSILSGNGDKQAQASDTTLYMKRIPVGYDEERSDIVLAFNFAAIKDSAQDLRLESMRLLDRVPIKISKFLVCAIVRADTLKVEYDGGGNVVSSTVKTLDEMPYVDIKWIKTFHSMTEFEKSLTAENNWGDGPVENPQKGVLNTALYEAETVIKGFENYMGAADEAYAALKAVHAEGDVVYNKADATTEEYLTAIENINAAVEEFYSYVNPSEKLVYNYIRTSDAATSLYALADEVTKDSYTGRPLALGANESAIPLTFVPVGESGGQQVYNLKSKDGVVVSCTDGTLLLVKGSSAAAAFTFADRDGYGLFDMKCGSFYYYKSGYELKTVNAFPEVSYDDMQPYLFQIEDALESYNPTEDEKSGLFEAWEFNGEAEEDPSTKGTINGAELVMGEYGQTFMLDGWRMQRWRMWSRVNKGTYKSEDGEDLGCLKLTAAETYDSFDGTSLGNATVYPASPSMRREGGVFTNFYDRDPAGGVRDESCLVNLNPGVRRYLAIKCKGTNPDITVDVFNFLSKPETSATDFVLNLADAEAKGDVYYWDLLKYISVGKMPYVSQYFSTMGFQKDDALYIDWIRTFETEEDIPSESFATAISDVQADGDGLKVFVTGRTINVFTVEAGAIYTVDGMRVASFEGTVHQTVLPGMYIVRVGDAVKKVLVR